MASRPQRLLVTRPLIDQDQTCDALRTIGVEPVSAPVMRAVRLDCAIPVRNWQAVVVTSRNGLRLLDDAEVAALRAVPVYCVGNRTQELAVKLGLNVAAPASPDMAHLSQCLPSALGPATGPVLYLTARQRTGGLLAALNKAGFAVTLVEIYEMAPEVGLSAEVIAAIKQGDIDGVLLYSQRTSRLFLSIAEKSGIAAFVKSLTYYCLSEPVSLPIKEVGYPLVVADAPNETSLLECVKKDRN